MELSFGLWWDCVGMVWECFGNCSFIVFAWMVFGLSRHRVGIVLGLRLYLHWRALVDTLLMCSTVFKYERASRSLAKTGVSNMNAHISGWVQAKDRGAVRAHVAPKLGK